MKIARVFPTKTSMSPDDNDAYFDAPDLFTPKYDEVHISVTFTWDKERARELAERWGNHANKLRIDGCAFGNSGNAFISGMYLRKGIIITSRGCKFNCNFCLVPKREGNILELPIVEGHIIQDNNFLACSEKHRTKVYQMLKTQKTIQFKGGLDKRLLTEWDVDQMKSLSIKELWFACDTRSGLSKLGKLTLMLRDFPHHKKMCYVLIGKDMDEEEDRLRQIYKMGYYPFAQLYRNEDDSIKYSKEWKRFARTWSRPAAYKTILESL